MGTRLGVRLISSLLLFSFAATASADRSAPSANECTDPEFQSVVGLLYKMQLESVDAESPEAFEERYLKAKRQFVESEAASMISPQMLDLEKEIDRRLNPRDFLGQFNLSAEDQDWMVIIRGGPEDLERAAKADAAEFKRVRANLAQEARQLRARARSTDLPQPWIKFYQASIKRKESRIVGALNEKKLAYLSGVIPQVKSRCQAYVAARGSESRRTPAGDPSVHEGDSKELFDDDVVVDGESVKKNLDFTRESHGLTR
jgi:hypothetical protein